jgi:hypothetical protein
MRFFFVIVGYSYTWSHLKIRERFFFFSHFFRNPNKVIEIPIFSTILRIQCAYIYIDVAQNFLKIICFQQKHFKISHASIKKICINNKNIFFYK